MIADASILALLITSFAVTLMLVYSCYYGIIILRNWDLRCGSDLQLQLERRTYLISTLVAYAMGFQLLSFFLFIHTVDGMSNLFVGAMCAAGTLKANVWGYRTLTLKLGGFILAGIWLIINATDNSARDYPLIKFKYGFLILATPVLAAETIAQASYFLELRPHIITSCCGALFSANAQGFTAGIIALPRLATEVGFFIVVLLTLVSGGVFIGKNRGAYLFSILNALTFIASILALISFISVYFYELPTHHCPFCILHREYGWVGYFLYLASLGAVLPALGAGAIQPFKTIASLKDSIPTIQRKSAIFSMLSLATFVALVTYAILASNLIL